MGSTVTDNFSSSRDGDHSDRRRQLEAQAAAQRAEKEARAAELRAQALKDAQRAIDGATGQSASRSREAYDSTQRRQALAAHLAKIGISPEDAAIRMLLEVSKAEPPPAAAWRTPAADEATARRKELERRLVKEKEAPGKDAPGAST